MIIQITIIIFSLFAISRIILRVRDKRVTRLGGLLWMTLFASIGVLVLLPNVMVFLSNIAGVQRGVDLFIYLSIITLFYLIFKMFVMVEKVSQELTACVRSIAIMENNINKKITGFKNGFREIHEKGKKNSGTNTRMSIDNINKKEKNKKNS